MLASYKALRFRLGVWFRRPAYCGNITDAA